MELPRQPSDVYMVVTTRMSWQPLHHPSYLSVASSTALRGLSIHLDVAPDIFTSCYKYPFSLCFS